MKGFVVSFTFLMCSFISMGMFQVVPSSKCVMQGEFPINDGTCQNYYMCIFNGAEFVTYSLKCAGSTLFDPSLKYCTSDYVCTQPTPTTALPTSSISTSPSSSSSSSPSSSSSSISTSSSSSISTSSSSSISTSPSSSSPSIPSTSTSISTSTPTSTTPSTTPIPCNGRYPLDDPKCQQYYFCYIVGGTPVRYNLTCPNSLRFNKYTQKCVLPTLYPCPSN